MAYPSFYIFPTTDYLKLLQISLRIIVHTQTFFVGDVNAAYFMIPSTFQNGQNFEDFQVHMKYFFQNKAVNLLHLSSLNSPLYKTNAQIAKELKITPILDKLLEYKRSWIQYVIRMPRNKLARVMKYYSPNGRRNRGRPLKRLLDT